ncbi:unnamed protein product [Scytosiphon promiscuus]
MAHEGLLLPEYSSLTGAWVLDLSRSDTMEDHLRLLDTPEASIRTQMERERTQQSHNAIAINENKLVIHKQAAGTSVTESFKFNDPQVTQTFSGDTRKSTASLLNDGQLTGYVVSITVSSDGLDLLQQGETRWLESGGHVHHQKLYVRNNVSGAQRTTMRTWVRVPMTSTDLVRLGRLFDE